MVEVIETEVHKNQGKTVDGTPVILLKRTEEQDIVMKTKTKRGLVDVEIAHIPRDDCFSRLENWRSLLKKDEQGNPRKVRLWRKGDVYVQIDIWITPDDVLEWDSPPVNLELPAWVPFYFIERYK